MSEVSATVTLKLHEAVFPVPSVTVNAFVVVPNGNVEPLGNPAVCEVVAPGALSAPTGAVYVTTAPLTVASKSTTMLSLQVILGGTVSSTVIDTVASAL